MRKTCSKCGETKPRTEFYRMKAARDGLRPNCKACAQAYYCANEDAVREYNRQYRETHAAYFCAYNAGRKPDKFARRLQNIRIPARHEQRPTPDNREGR